MLYGVGIVTVPREEDEYDNSPGVKEEEEEE